MFEISSVRFHSECKILNSIKRSIILLFRKVLNIKKVKNYKMILGNSIEFASIKTGRGCFIGLVECRNYHKLRFYG
ncbi:hypothetical protein [Leptospira kirschneri]|uniref:hypothetical protein n=1 Tax=Leptospira kirschneri TaxID=29507 RepID=UPI0009E24FE8